MISKMKQKVLFRIPFLYQKMTGVGLPRAWHESVTSWCSTALMTTWCETVLSRNVGATISKICNYFALKNSKNWNVRSKYLRRWERWGASFRWWVDSCTGPGWSARPDRWRVSTRECSGSQLRIACRRVFASCWVRARRRWSTTRSASTSTKSRSRKIHRLFKIMNSIRIEVIPCSFLRCARCSAWQRACRVWRSHTGRRQCAAWCPFCRRRQQAVPRRSPKRHLAIQRRNWINFRFSWLICVLVLVVVL